MGLFSALLVASVISGQGAPSDVPKNHWAYPAVNQLFEEGLLKGYPAQGSKPLKLEKIPWDAESALGEIHRLEKKLGSLSLFVDPMGHMHREDWSSLYIQCIAAYHLGDRVRNLANEVSGKTKAVSSVAQSRKDLENNLTELEAIVRLIGMTQDGIRRLDGDPDKLVRDLEQLRFRYSAQFKG